MAIRSLLTHLQQLRYTSFSRSINSYLKHSTPTYISCSLHQIRAIGVTKRFNFLRSISSNTLPASSFHDQTSYKEDNDIDLKSKLLSLAHPRRSATNVLQKWVSEGRRVSIYDLRGISKQLVERGRYKHALEVMKWMESQDRFHISETDHALRLELTLKASTLQEAEHYFTNLPTITSQKASYLHLLNSYVKQNATQKAESLMTKMHSVGANVTPHPFNSMMKLYIATSNFTLVLSIISQMKQNNIPRNILSYNLWMSACYALHGVTYVDKVYNEMVNDHSVKIGWSSLCTLANIYIKSGLLDKAKVTLREAETKLSLYNHFGYFFLITNYTSLKNKEGVVRVWEACKRVDRKLTCANYMCIMSCFIKLGDVKEAERIFMEWECQCIRYDVRVSNILLGCYVRENLMEKAESLHMQTVEKGGCPNYKTWEILMEGYVRNGDMEKAVFAMKNACEMMKGCEWRPSREIVECVLGYLEKSGNLEDGMWFLKVLRGLDLAGSRVYRMVIGMRVGKGEGVDEIVKMMEDDEVDVDDETRKLVEGSKVGVLL